MLIHEQEFYKTIGQPAIAEFKDRGSRFIAYAYPVETEIDFKKYLQLLKKEHPKATHHCFAYRIGIDGNNFRISDNGEPSGTAGRPILEQIDSKELNNIAVIVVRYFGGTLLGVPGLIKAYKTVTSLALQVARIVSKPNLVTYLIHFDYTRINEVMMVLKQYTCIVIAQEKRLFFSITTGIPKSRLGEVLSGLNEFQNIEIKKIN